ncbi:hypothetical protein M569_01033 [Genlisea aurea]|uniref:non-specific serine/threonine protein kinase n=1 Tax=Genlisea aurea TaxID=192259 RepID=S8ECP5_9LAMI|nr:hypothetical protein M569_01033 [Genlisea aurea]
MAACYRAENLSDTILDSVETATIHDRYVLGKQLGLGQFGVIRECVHRFTGEVFACKSIAKDRLVTQDDANSIKLEIEIMMKLSGHPNVVDLKAVYEEEEYVHLLMELCAGGELFDRLEKNGRFSECEAGAIFKHLMQVVMYCHDKGVVHRDLKPENILLATNSSSSPIKLADFGLATYITPGKCLNGMVGSPFYIAPEVLGGSYDEAADVWSAGVILYILLSGIPPFWGKTKSRIFDAVRAADLRFPANLWDSVSDSAKELIRNMLCRDTSKRLTPRQVLDHPWVTDSILLSDDFLRNELNELSCCSSLMARDQDISFGVGGPIISDVQSPCFTCKSSFSSIPSISLSPEAAAAAVGFSFSCSHGVPPIPSFPSFTFSQPSSSKEMSNKYGSRRNHTFSVGEVEHKHVDAIGAESVIRWASCTNLPTTTTASLRSSLVC